MRFLIDAQLPPSLAEWLAARGHEANHVRTIGLLNASDHAIAAHARATAAVIVTKDADFARLASAIPDLAVVWLRFGNAATKDLIRTLDPVFAEAEAALAGGQTLVEISR